MIRGNISQESLKNHVTVATVGSNFEIEQFFCNILHQDFENVQPMLTLENDYGIWFSIVIQVFSI